MKTTQADFEKYKAYCNYWLKELGLTDWHVYFDHKPVEGVYARTNYRVSSRTATIELAAIWDKFRAITDAELRANALHEVMHLVTAPLLVEAEDRYTNEVDVEAAEHGIVVRLTNYILSQEKAK